MERTCYSIINRKSREVVYTGFDEESAELTLNFLKSGSNEFVLDTSYELRCDHDIYITIGKELCHNLEELENSAEVAFIDPVGLDNWIKEKDNVRLENLPIFGIDSAYELPIKIDKVYILTIFSKKKWGFFRKRDKMDIMCYLRKEDFKYEEYNNGEYRFREVKVKQMER